MAQNWKYKKKDVIFKEGSFKPIFMSYGDCVNIMLGEARNLRNKKKKITLSVKDLYHCSKRMKGLPWK